VFCGQYILDADGSLRHIRMLEGLRIGDLAETVKCCPLVNGGELLIGHLIRLVSGISDELMDKRQELLRELNKAKDWIQQQQ